MDSLQSIVEALTELPFEQLQFLSDVQLDNLRDDRLRQRHFDNAAKDFVTVVLNTKEIAPDEDSIRLELIRIVHLCEGATLHLAVNGSDDEFRRRCEHRMKPVAFQVLQLLRVTASVCSATEEALSEWLSCPAAYKDDFSSAFRSIVETARLTLAGTHSDIAPMSQ